MTDIRSSRPSTLRACTVCAVAAAAVAALGWALSTPGGFSAADGNPAVTLTSVTAETYLTGPGLINVPGVGIDEWPAKSMAGFLSSDTQLANAQLDHQPTSFATFTTTVQNDFYDFLHQPYLTGNAPIESGTVLPGAAPWSEATNLLNESEHGTVLTPAPGVTLTAPTLDFHPEPGTGPQSGDSASELLADVKAEGGVVEHNLTAVDNEWMQVSTNPATADSAVALADELGPISEAATLQGEINAAVGALGPITAADEHNPFLVWDLSSLLNAENAMNNTLVDFYINVDEDNAQGLTADNMALGHNGEALFDAAQNTAGFFEFSDFLSSLGL